MAVKYVLKRDDGSCLKVNGWEIKHFDNYDEAVARCESANKWHPKNKYTVVRVSSLDRE
jgi:hypothetical protein